MRYQKFPPVAALRPFVECYFVWEGEVLKKTEVQSPPNCFGAIVFNYGDPSWAYQHTSPVTPVPDAFVCGLFTSNYHRVLKGKIGMVGIVFKPSAVHNFFNLRMSNLVNSRMPLNLLIGKDADALLVSIQKESTDEERIKQLEDFVLLRLPEAKKRLSIIDEAIDYIDENKGAILVDEVSNHLKISRRYLEKQFLEKVGVSPKFYARIKRFGILSNKVAHSEKIDWQDVVLESGLHDQSHLSKEFLEFNHMNPSDYHQHHHEMTRFLKN
jgi:AraC-like DNA-binding protein